MSFDPNDPRVTALALGELPEDERLAIEAEIADDPEAAAALAEIAATAQLLTEQFRLETEFSPVVGLDASQKQAIEDCLAAAPVVAASPETIPFRPTPPAKPLDVPASVPPSRSMFQLRVAAGIVAVGTVAAGVAVMKFGVLDNDPPLARAVAPAAPGGPIEPALAAPVGYPQIEGAIALPVPITASGAAEAKRVDPQALARPRTAGDLGGEERDRVAILDSVPGDNSIAGGIPGGGGGRMMGSSPANSPAPPRPMFAPQAPARSAPSPAGGPQAGMMGGGMGGNTGNSRGLQPLLPKGMRVDQQNLSQGQRGQQGQNVSEGQQGQGQGQPVEAGQPLMPFGQGQNGQGQGKGGQDRRFADFKAELGGEPASGKLQFDVGTSTYGGLKAKTSVTGGDASKDAPAPAPEPMASAVATPAPTTAGKPAVTAKPGAPAEGRVEEMAAKGDFAAVSNDATRAEVESLARNQVGDKQKNQDLFNYQALSTRVKELKDIPATAPVEVKLRADRLQREGEVVLKQLQLAEAKPDQNARDFDAKRQDVERFGKELQEVAQQVEEARKFRLNDEEFGKVQDNPFQVVNAAPLSTFSVDVDTASYANVRRFLNQNTLPPKDSVRIEELINYFTYDDPAPMAASKEPFSLNVESAACPWSDKNRLVRVGLKGKAVADDKRPASNLVFLVDVSGSMADLDKLPLLKAAMKLLVDNLTENDRVAIVTYANGVRVALPSTPCHRKPEILSALEGLEAGGGTNGAGGIQRAYDIAIQNFIKGGTNRVLLATDGDFNVGISDTNELVTMIQEKAKSGVFLSVLGFGQGNLKDDRMEQLADKGNGQYSYIDSTAEARKVLVKQMGGTIVTIAKDVKVQVEFNPSKVAAYRLIGYENRMLQAQDFRDDKKDAGEIGAGLSVTALYEIVPAGADANPANNVNLRFQNVQNRAGVGSPEWLHVAIRYKAPDGDVSTEFGKDLVDDGRPFARASNDLKFASAVAGFGMLLRDSPYKGRLTWPAVEELTLSGLGTDSGGYRHEFQGLVKKAASLAKP